MISQVSPRSRRDTGNEKKNENTLYDKLAENYERNESR